MQDVDRTIISQYATAATLVAMIESGNAAIDPAADLDLFYDMVWNLDTAQGYGLDVWGRIVGVGRVLQVASGLYFGFAEPADDSISPFNSGGPFFAGHDGTTSNFPLTDEGFRVLILAKAYANITDGSIAAFNQILMLLFAGRGNSYVVDNQDMTMEVNLPFTPSPFEVSIVVNSGVMPRPAGVSMSLVHP